VPTILLNRLQGYSRQVRPRIGRVPVHDAASIDLSQ
jgi:hypothetical protein